MVTLETFVTVAVVAVVVIGGVVYILRRKSTIVNNQNIIKRDYLSSNDILSWIDEILPSINLKTGYTYIVNILPSSSTSELLSRPIKNAYAVILLGKNGEKISCLHQRIYIARELSNELKSLQDDKVIEIPIQL